MTDDDAIACVSARIEDPQFRARLLISIRGYLGKSSAIVDARVATARKLLAERKDRAEVARILVARSGISRVWANRIVSRALQRDR